MKIDYLIATLNSFDPKKNIFQSLKKQSNRNFKIIIVDQGIKNFDFNIIDNLDFEYHKLDKKGLSNARNYGLKYCTNKFVAFLDDDATVNSDFTSKIIKSCKLNNSDIICGLILDPILNRPLSRSIKNINSRILNINNYRYFMGSGIVIKLSLIQKHPFDIQFGAGSKYGSAEETDLFFRLINRNRIFFDSTLVIKHFSDHQKLNSFSFIDSFYRGHSYGLGFGACLKKHYLINKSSYFLNEFCKSTLFFFIVILFDLFKLNFKLFLRNIGSFSGRIYGFLSFKIK